MNNTCLHAQLLGHVRLFATTWTVTCRVLCPWDSPCKNTGVGCHFLLQGVFLTQGSNLGLLHCMQPLYPCAAWEAQRAMYICFSNFTPWTVGLLCGLFPLISAVKRQARRIPRRLWGGGKGRAWETASQSVLYSYVWQPQASTTYLFTDPRIPTQVMLSSSQHSVLLFG